MRVLLLSLVLLGGCCKTLDTGLAKPVQIPPIPEALAKKAGSLPKLEERTMGALVLDGAASDMQYNSVAHQNNKLIDLYNCVRESINNKKEIECL
jgi:hypothetical protein